MFKRKTFARHEVATEVLLGTEVFWDVKGASSTPWRSFPKLETTKPVTELYTSMYK